MCNPEQGYYQENRRVMGNSYATLSTKEEEDKFFWGIKDWDTMYWEEIPEYLFNALMRFQSEAEAGSVPM
jgi:hypothetical protein